jgi:hypothetical protein
MTTMKLGPANKEKDKNCPPHEPSGWQCCVAHFGADGELLPACHQCLKCGRQVRPDAMDKPVEVRFCDICGVNEWTNGDPRGVFCEGCRKTLDEASGELKP